MPTETDLRLADQLRETNQRLTEAIHEVSAKLDNFRVEVTKDLGDIRVNLERYQAETATSLKFLGKSVTILIPIVVALVVSLVGAAIGGTWYASKLDSRVERLESPAVQRGLPK
jgi:hypothetical protein